MKSTVLKINLILAVLILVHACSKDKIDPDADRDLFNQVNGGAYTFYQNGNILSPQSPSPHGNFKLRFNSVAAAALDSTGELPAGSTFPDNSIIVKEVHNGNDITLYAVMKKDPTNVNASNGWLWAEINPSGQATYSTNKKGVECAGCHSDTPNRDFTRTFDLH